MVTCRPSSDPAPSHRVHQSDQIKSPAKAGLLSETKHAAAPLVQGTSWHRLFSKSSSEPLWNCARIYLRRGAYWFGEAPKPIKFRERPLCGAAAKRQQKRKIRP